MNQKRARVIAVADNKGGVGKTTTAANVAYWLAASLVSKDGIKGRVLIVDLDKQGNQADLFGVREKLYSATNPEGACISAVLLDPDATPKQYMVSLDRPEAGLRRPNLYLVPATAELENALTVLRNQDAVNEFTAFQARGRAARTAVRRQLDTVLADRLGKFLDTFTYIVLDCPPNLSDLKRAVYGFADDVIVPAKADYLSLVGAQQHTVEMLQLIEEMGAKARILAVVPTMAQEWQVLPGQIVNVLQEKYGNVLADSIPQSADVRDAPAKGRLVYEYAPRSKGALAYSKLGQFILRRMG